MPETTSWYVGLDCGGSKTVMLAASPRVDRPVRQTGPAAHLQHMSPSQTAGVLAELLQSFLSEQPSARLASVCAGVAGAGRPAGQQLITDELSAALGAAAPDPTRVRIVHDGVIALEAAFAGESGIITITGTGSLALARTRDGSLLRAGGWGHLLGDNGSGHSLGRRGLRAVAASLDGGPSTLIRDLLDRHHDLHSIDDLIDVIYQPDWPIQQVAPLVLEAAEQGDEAALEALRRETSLLARQVRWLAERCASIEKQLAPLGGLVSEAFYRRQYVAALREELPAWQVREPAHEPVVGALRLARKLAGD